MPFSFKPTILPGVALAQSGKIEDGRGYFMEAYKRSDFASAGFKISFEQDNFSVSKRGVLRGLHFQLPPFAQGKLIRVLEGKIWDVAVDIRKSSSSFKQWLGVELSEENALALYIPEGFAHGFVALSGWARVLYKTTEEYNQNAERGIAWNDPELNITWPVKHPDLSEKDRGYPALSEAEIFS